jgi:hypothetical protein
MFVSSKNWLCLKIWFALPNANHYPVVRSEFPDIGNFAEFFFGSFFGTDFRRFFRESATFGGVFGRWGASPGGDQMADRCQPALFQVGRQNPRL